LLQLPDVCRITVGHAEGQHERQRFTGRPERGWPIPHRGPIELPNAIEEFARQAIELGDAKAGSEESQDREGVNCRHAMRLFVSGQSAS
jgi:hypothetical protein